MIEQDQELAPGPAVQRQSRLSKPLAAVWDLAVQTVGLAATHAVSPGYSLETV